MESDHGLPERIDFDAGQRIELAGLGRVWRIHEGFVGVVQAQSDAADEPLELLALPGDLLGAGNLLAPGAPVVARSVTRATLEAVRCDAQTSPAQLLSQAYGQSRRQCRDLLRLRGGPVADRVKQLLVLLGDHAAGRTGQAELELPLLRDLAWIIDSSPESVCRVLARLRDLRVLQTVAPRTTRMVMKGLRELQAPMGMTASARAIVQGFSLAS